MFRSSSVCRSVKARTGLRDFLIFNAADFCILDACFLPCVYALMYSDKSFSRASAVISLWHNRPIDKHHHHVYNMILLAHTYLFLLKIGHNADGQRVLT